MTGAEAARLRGRRLAIVLSAPGDLPRAAAVCRAARVAELEVSVFAMADAVADLARARAEVMELIDEGVELIACARSAHERGLDEAAVGVELGSQDDHAALVHAAERVIAFT